MPLYPSITVSRLDAARRQLRTALELWFAEGDAVSIHSLACSAHQIVHDLNRNAKGPEMLFDSVVFKDEHRKEAVAFLKRDMNFFKHADLRRGKTEDAIDFRPMSTEVFLLITIIGIEFLGQTFNELELAFLSWCTFNRPTWVRAKHKQQLEHALSPDGIAVVQGLRKSEFLYAFLEATKGSSLQMPGSHALREEH